ncbi:MAG TPA: DUF2381 family protein [Archangium sp.]|jgi:uncharacterized protein (TIGR02268 family)|uniref:DUF2381 family protein n=1 Tax=Archangium sp. TaxID=1872627 RepID=UPI002ED7B304
MMRNVLLSRSTLLLALMASVAGASGREPNERNLYLSDHPSRETSNVYVVGGIVTVLRLEQPCDSARTRMLGWEGRFAPVECVGKKVLLEPLHDIRPEDRFLLLVTLADGTELPFTVTSRQETTDDRTGDQQVNVFRDHKAPNAVLASLYDSLGRERELNKEVERYRKEDTADHALAALLAKGAGKMTLFRELWTKLFKGTDGVEIRASVLASKNRDKAAVIFKVKNNSPNESWSLMEARLLTESGGEPRPFALRTSREHWGPGGESGQIAVVMDMRAFDSKKGPERLVLEIFRGDGLRQVYVLLDRRMMR